MLFAGVLLLATLACGRGAAAGVTETPPPPPTPTAHPAPSPLPSGSDLQALILYANQMAPLLAEAGELLQADGEILKASEGGDDDVLCDGRLAADNRSMKDILSSVEALSPPEEAAAIHGLVVESGNAWTEALDSIATYCATGNALHKIPAALKFWEAGAKFQDAGNRFWLLLVSQGIEDWVQR